jgi:transposase
MNLRRLRQFSESGHLDLYYADESTFSMNPCLPYGWQAKGETVGIVPQGNRKTNVFGIFNSDNRCFTSFSAHNINSEFVVESIERFCRQLSPEKPTVLVLDNAAMHHSRLFQANLDAWQKRGLYIFYLPKYSPHLNIAETFWRKAKYEWLKPASYLSFESFKQKVAYIFANIGTEYKINFRELKCQSNSA